jgi:hypothetical protein
MRTSWTTLCSVVGVLSVLSQYAAAAMGRRSKRHSRWLFEASYHVVGDFAETVTHIAVG